MIIIAFHNLPIFRYPLFHRERYIDSNHMQTYLPEKNINRLKDCDPYETITRIRHILEKLKIFVTEKWIDSSVSALFSVRVQIAGTNIGTNGKGVTRLLALASAYGEFMERLSCGILLNDLGIDICPHYSFLQKVPFAEVTKGNTLIDSILFPLEHMSNKINNFKDERISELICFNMYPEDDIECLPYTLLNSDQETLLPLSLYHLYGTNGMAAGNTLTEAIVQAISEIMERWSLYNIFKKKLCPPTVNRHLIESYYPEISAIIDEIEKKERFQLEIRDCSLGQGFPVYCVCLVDQHKHRYSISFGASPNIRVGLERILTELVQGRQIEEVAWASPGSPHLMEPFELRRLFKSSAGNYPVSFFRDNPAWDIDECLFLQHFDTNPQAIEWFSDLCERDNKKIYFRECGVFGFPCVHVIIPGYSEVMAASNFYRKYLTSLFRAKKILNNIYEASKTELHFVLEMLDFLRKVNATDFSLFTRIVGPYNMGRQESILFFLMRGFMEIGDYSRASELCNILRKISHKDTEIINCICDSLNLRASLSASDVHNILSKFYPSQIVNRAIDLISSPLVSFISSPIQTPEVAIDTNLILETVKNFVPSDKKS